MGRSFSSRNSNSKAVHIHHEVTHIIFLLKPRYCLFLLYSQVSICELTLHLFYVSSRRRCRPPSTLSICGLNSQPRTSAPPMPPVSQMPPAPQMEPVQTGQLMTSSTDERELMHHEYSGERKIAVSKTISVW